MVNLSLWKGSHDGDNGFTVVAESATDVGYWNNISFRVLLAEGTTGDNL